MVFPPLAILQSSGVLVSLVVDEHRQYLTDEPRLEAYRRAVEEVVRPGDVVVDLGSGTGILGMLAARAGAARVYSIEAGGMIELARAISKANGFQDRVRFVKGYSTRVELPEKADMVVCDQIGRFGFEAGVIQLLADARRRLLKPEGRVIPSRIDLMVAPVECREVREQIEFWLHSPAGFDFTPARKWSANSGYPVKYSPSQLLAEPARLHSVDLTQDGAAPFRAEASMNVARNGELDGVAGWFQAQLSPGVTMTNSPLSATPIERRNVFLPVDRPVAVETGNRVHARMNIIPAEIMLSWKVQVWKGDGDDDADSERGLKGSFHHSTLHGMLLCREDLRRTHPDFVPRLDPWGEARLTVLKLCDGRRLADIERDLAVAHPELFSEPGSAGKFVAEVVTRYSL